MYSGYSDFLPDLLDIQEYKRKADIIAAHCSKSSILHDYALKIKGCGTCIGFDLFQDDFGVIEHKLVAANFCRLRLCPMCQRRKSLRAYSEIIRIAESLNSFKFIHLVLTIPNVSAQDLSAAVSRLFSSSRRLFSLSAVKKAFKGVLRACEVTYNSDRKDYHPHLHCLVAVNSSYFSSRDYLSQAELLRLWNCFVGRGGVFLKKCTQTAAAVAEVAKYAVKPFESELRDHELISVLETLHVSLKGRRLIQFFGVFREKAAELKINLDDDLELENSLAQFNYYYNEFLGKYVRME